MRAEAVQATRAAGRRRTQGFTLLEVLVALALLALALTALVRLSGLEANSSAHLRDVTLAQWVASNAVAETRLRERFPGVGRREGEARMGTRRWRWRMQIQPTDEASIRRLDVQVFALQDEVRLLDDADPVATLTGFVAQ